jgi:hypothetical protein
LKRITAITEMRFRKMLAQSQGYEFSNDNFAKDPLFAKFFGSSQFKQWLHP